VLAKLRLANAPGSQAVAAPDDVGEKPMSEGHVVSDGTYQYMVIDASSEEALWLGVRR
jgi:hypothetical protein